MPGDGIGKTVLPEAIRVLNAVGFDAEYVHGDIGWDFWCSEGNALPQRTIDLLKKHKLGLFGAITSKPKDAAEKELDPSLKGKGYVYFSPIVSMRQIFNLDILKPFFQPLLIPFSCFLSFLLPPEKFPCFLINN